MGVTEEMSRRNSQTISCLLILFSMFQSALALGKTSLNFSRSPLELRSPNGIYEIHNTVHPANFNNQMLYVEQPDTLVLRKVKDGSNDLLTLKYHRNVDVLWASDSRSFVVNKWDTNSHCDAVLYQLNNLRKPISIGRKLLSSGISAEEKKALTNADHSYIFVDKWDGADSVVVKASGHYFPSGKPTVSYTFYYRWTISSNSWKLINKESVENLKRAVPNMEQFGA